MESNLFYDRCGILKVVSPQILKHFYMGRAIVKTTNLFKWAFYVGKKTKKQKNGQYKTSYAELSKS